MASNPAQELLVRQATQDIKEIKATWRQNTQISYMCCFCHFCSNCVQITKTRKDLEEGGSKSSKKNMELVWIGSISCFFHYIFCLGIAFGFGPCPGHVPRWHAFCSCISYLLNLLLRSQRLELQRSPDQTKDTCSEHARLGNQNPSRFVTFVPALHERPGALSPTAAGPKQAAALFALLSSAHCESKRIVSRAQAQIALTLC